MLLLLLYIFQVFAEKPKTMDVEIYTSELFKEGVILQNNRFSIGENPTKFKLVRDGPNYFIETEGKKGKNGRPEYLAINNNNLITTTKKAPWIIRKSKIISDDTKVNHYQLESSSKCLSKADRTLKGTDCNIGHETQMFFFTPACTKANKKLGKNAMNDFMKNVVDTIYTVSPDGKEQKQENKNKKCPKADAYQILIERQTDVVTTTVAIVSLPPEANKIINGPPQDKKKLASQMDNLIKTKDKRRLKIKDKSTSSSNLGLSSSKMSKGGRNRKSTQGNKVGKNAPSRGGAAGGSRGQGSGGASGGSKGQGSGGAKGSKRQGRGGSRGQGRGGASGESDSGSDMGQRGRRSRRGSESGYESDMNGKERGDYSDMKNSQSDNELLMSDSSAQEGGLGQNLKKSSDSVDQIVGDLKRQSSGEREDGYKKEIVLAKSVEAKKIVGIPGNLINQIQFSVPSYKAIEKNSLATSITVPAGQFASKTNGPFTQSNQSSPYAPNYPQSQGRPGQFNQPMSPGFQNNNFGNPNVGY